MDGDEHTLIQVKARTRANTNISQVNQQGGTICSSKLLCNFHPLRTENMHIKVNPPVEVISLHVGDRSSKETQPANLFGSCCDGTGKNFDCLR